MSFDADAQLLRKIFRIRVDYDGEIIIIDGMDLLTYSEDLDEDRNNVLLDVQRIAGILAEVQNQYDDMKVELDALKGRLDYHTREYTLGKKATEEQVKNTILRDPNYVEASKKLAKLYSVVRRLKMLLSNLRDKKDILVEKGADRRLEVQYEVGISKLPKMRGQQ